MEELIIVGAGAAGLSAAIRAADGGMRPLVLEGSPKAGRKILLSGSGRCNLAPGTPAEDAYEGSCASFAESLLLDGKEALFSFFRECGIPLRSVGSGIYPMSEESASVLGNLLETAQALGVRIKTNAMIRGIGRTAEGFVLEAGDWRYEAKKVILAAGTCAATEMPGGGHLAEMLGLSSEALVPALCGLYTEGGGSLSWDGARVRGGVRILADGRETGRSFGQIQLTKRGISGIPVFDVSGRAARALREGKRVTAELDLLPEMSAKEAEERLNGKDRGGSGMLRGILPERAARQVLRFLKDTGREASPSALASVLKSLVLTVRSTAPMSAAQCASGGVLMKEIDRETMECVRIPGLYLCGEMLDADGICGGYNLSFAFLTGQRAGRAAAEGSGR